MEQQDLELLRSKLEEDEELASLWAEHMELESKLDDMAQRVYLSPAEEMERKRLQKIKLSGRDKIEQLLAKYR